MATVLIIMAFGMLVGFLLSNYKKIIKVFDKITQITIYILLFLLGVGVGLNKKIVDNIGVIGVQALLICVGALLGSLVMAYIVYKLFFFKKNEK